MEGTTMNYLVEFYGPGAKIWQAKVRQPDTATAIDVAVRKIWGRKCFFQRNGGVVVEGPIRCPYGQVFQDTQEGTTSVTDQIRVKVFEIVKW
jgi:hypothetical protein